MAALDSRLRRGERFVQRLDDIGAAASRFFAGLKSAGAAKRGGGSPAPDEAQPGAGGKPAVKYYRPWRGTCSMTEAGAMDEAAGRAPISFAQFEAVDIRVGTIIDAQPFSRGAQTRDQALDRFRPGDRR